MSKERKQRYVQHLHTELVDALKQHSSGLLTDVELLLCCEQLQGLYAELDLSRLRDPNTGLEYPRDFAPFAHME